MQNQSAYGFWNFANDATKELLCIVEGSACRFQVEYRVGRSSWHDFPSCHPNMVCPLVLYGCPLALFGERTCYARNSFWDDRTCCLH